MLNGLAFGVALSVAAMVGSSGRVAQESSAACVVPSEPSELAARVLASSVRLTWKGSLSGAPTEYNVEYGDAPGSTYIGTFDTKSRAPAFTRALSPGVYYIRVRAKNACGLSETSPEIRVAVNTNQVAPPTTPDVVVVRRQSDRNPYFPTIERLKNGELLVVYYDSQDHLSPAGRIAMVRSRDDGRTWSEPTVLFDSPRDERDPNIVQTSRGTVLVSYFEYVAGNPVAMGAYVSRSDDDGHTWSSPVKVDTVLKGTATSAKIIEIENGDLLIPLYGLLSIGGHAVASVVRSTDGGRSWPQENETLFASDPGRDYFEPALVNVGGGRLLAMLRTDPSPHRAYETYSLDGGRTWSAPAVTELNAQASDLLALTGGPDTVVVHTWGDWSRRFGASRPTMMQVMRFETFPGPARSDRMRLLYHGNCFDDESYPSSVLMPSGQIFTVYYDACAGYVAGTFSTVSDAEAAGCRDTPAPPRNLRLVYNRERRVTMAWDGTLVAPDSYILQASRTPGAADLLDLELGRMTSFSVPLVDTGTYYVQVRAQNGCGAGRPSNRLVVVVP